MRRGLLVTLVALLVVPALAGPAPGAARAQVRIRRIAYRAHDGVARRAYVVLPAWYGPRDHPPIPLVISPHGRGVSALANARLWGALPARGGFAVISPDGQGRRLERFSWGSPGQIDDLARMPRIARADLPWLRVDRHRVYAVGGSMGGQETLLLVARQPGLLAGAAALDAVTNLAQQYRSFPDLACDRACRHAWHGPLGRKLQELARKEIGGGPSERPVAFATRSPLTYARAIAWSCVPLELWWSVKDRVVLDPQRQSEALYAAVTRINPDAPIAAYVGFWRHSAEMHVDTRLPAVLAGLGLLPPVRNATAGLHVLQPSTDAVSCSPGGA